MKIVRIEFLDHIIPNMSCGTGYSEPDKFAVMLDNGDKKIMWVDVWYMPKDNIKGQFIRSVHNTFGDIENMEEAFEMYQKEMEDYYDYN